MCDYSFLCYYFFATTLYNIFSGANVIKQNLILELVNYIGAEKIEEK